MKKIITWNMESWGTKNNTNRQEEGWNKILTEIRPDIALLQECLELNILVKFECVSSSSDGLKVFCDEKTKDKVFWRKSHTSIKRNNVWGTAIYISGKNLNKTIYEAKELYPNDELFKGKMMMLHFDEILIASVHIDTGTYLPVTGKKHLESVFNENFINENKENLIIGGDLNADKKYEQNRFSSFFNMLETYLDDTISVPDGTKWNKETKKRYKIQDDHIFVPKKTIIRNKKVYSFEKELENLSDHTILEIELDNL